MALKSLIDSLNLEICVISDQKSVSWTELSLNNYSLNKQMQPFYIFLTNDISVVNDIINIHRASTVLSNCLHSSIGL